MPNFLSPPWYNALVEPVIFDKWRSIQRGEVPGIPEIGPMRGAGGASWGEVGAGGGSRGIGPAGTASPGWQRVGGYGRFAKDLPSGGRVHINIERNPNGSAGAEVILSKGGTTVRERVARQQGTGNIRDALRHYGEAADAVEEFVTKVRPRALHFTAGDKKLAGFYNKALGPLAKKLGGEPYKTGPDSYRIVFNNPTIYPLPKNALQGISEPDLTPYGMPAGSVGLD